MQLDRESLEPNVDYGNVSGYIVRLDVEIPLEAINGRREDGGPAGCLLLTHEEAEDLARQLLSVSAWRQAAERR